VERSVPELDPDHELELLVTSIDTELIEEMFVEVAKGQNLTLTRNWSCS